MLAGDYTWLDTGKMEMVTADTGATVKYFTQAGANCTSMNCGRIGEIRTDAITLKNREPITLTFRNQGYKVQNQNWENYVLYFYDSMEKTNGFVFVGNGGAWWRNNTQSWQGNLSNSCSDADLSVLRDAVVTLTIMKDGNTVNVSGIATTSEGKTATINSSAVSNTRMGDSIVLQLSGENCTLSDISYKAAKYESVDLKEIDSKTWNKMPERTGGYLAEMDFYSLTDTSLASMNTAYGQPLYVSAPEPGNAAGFMNTSLYNYAKQYTQTFEYALHSADFIFRNSDTKYKLDNAYNLGGGNYNDSYSFNNYKDAENDGKHYSDLFDMDSLVNNFIFCEYAMNWDSMKNSFFYYKDVDKKAVIAPQWDFDWCWGNTNMYNIDTNLPTKWHTTNKEFTVEQYYQTVQWNRMLIRDPYFIAKAYEKYKEVRPIIENMIKSGGLIDQYKTLWKEAGAANDNRWRYTYNGEYYNGATPQNFADSVTHIQSFLNTRVAWLDKQFESIDTLTKSLGYYTANSGIQITTARSGDNLIIKATCNDSQAKKLAFQVNGKIISSETLQDGKAYGKMDVKELSEDSLNTIVVNEIGENDKYITATGVLKRQVYANPKSNYANVMLTDVKTDDGTLQKEYDAAQSTKDNTQNGTNNQQNNTQQGGDRQTVDEKTPTLKLNVTKLTMQKGKSCTGLVASGMIKGDKVASYRSSNSKVVKVTSKGKLTAKKLGKATITVTTKLGAKKSFKVKVQKGVVKTKKISLGKKSVSLKKGKKYTIKIALSPISASEKITYQTWKKSVATVSNKGVVKARKKGTTKITVKSGKKKATLNVKVK